MNRIAVTPTAIRHRRLGQPALGAVACLGLLLAALCPDQVAAQGPAPAAQLPPKSFMNKSVFYLPVIIQDNVRGSLREIQLYRKDHPSQDWILENKGAPTLTMFAFRPPQDGEYWFTVVTIDKAGRQMPPDLRGEGPGVIVVQDSQQPQVDLHPMPPGSEGQYVQCEVRDANPDPSRTRLEYQTADGVWRAGDLVAGRPDTYCIPAQAMHTGLVKVTAADRAGNTTVREMNLSHVSMSLTPPPQTAQGAGPVKGGPGPVPPGEGVVHAGGFQSAPKPAQPSAAPPRPLPSGPELSQGPTLPASPPESAGIEKVAAQTAPASDKGSQVPATRRLVNNTHVVLEYQLESVGASGVGKVEVYVTADQGQTWQKLCEDADHRSPVEIDLPGEGVYGLSLVVSNGRGFGATPPSPGDTPDWWIEVDVTNPRAELYTPRPGAGQDSTALQITWSANDKNLSSDPIELLYAVNREGPWTSIAKGLKNDGRYRWLVPQEIGPLAFIRMVVTDKAGNSTKVETSQAVALDDLSRPRARVVDIAPQTSKATPAAGTSQ